MGRLYFIFAFLVYAGSVSAATEVDSLGGRDILDYVRVDGCSDLKAAKQKISELADEKKSKYYFVLNSGGAPGMVFTGAVLLSPGN